MRTLEGHEEYADYLSRQRFVARGKLDIHYVGRLSCATVLSTDAFGKEQKTHK